MIFSVDGVTTWTVNLDISWCVPGFPCIYNANKQPWDKPFYILLNLAVGGGFFPIDQYGAFDALASPKTWSQPTFFIDYVRVYQKSPVSIT